MTDSMYKKNIGRIEQKAFMIASDKKTCTKAVHAQNAHLSHIYQITIKQPYSPYISFTVESKSIYGHIRTLGT